MDPEVEAALEAHRRDMGEVPAKYLGQPKDEGYPDEIEGEDLDEDEEDEDGAAG